MSLDRAVFCGAGAWTNIYTGTGFTGFLWISSAAPPQVLSLTLSSAAPPFRWTDTKEFGTGLLEFFPTPFLVVEVLPPTSVTLRVSGTPL